MSSRGSTGSTSQHEPGEAVSCLQALNAIFHRAWIRAILLIGGYETARGRMTIGEFAAFNLYLEQLIWPLIAMGYVTNLVQRGAASLKRMHEIVRSSLRLRTRRRRHGAAHASGDGTTKFAEDRVS